MRLITKPNMLRAAYAHASHQSHTPEMIKGISGNTKITPTNCTTIFGVINFVLVAMVFASTNSIMKKQWSTSDKNHSPNNWHIPYPFSIFFTGFSTC
jgi:hypothetical protein